MFLLWYKRVWPGSKRHFFQTPKNEYDTWLDERGNGTPRRELTFSELLWGLIVQGTAHVLLHLNFMAALRGSVTSVLQIRKCVLRGLVIHPVSQTSSRQSQVQTQAYPIPTPTPRPLLRGSELSRERVVVLFASMSKHFWTWRLPLHAGRDAEKNVGRGILKLGRTKMM